MQFRKRFGKTGGFTLVDTMMGLVIVTMACATFAALISHSIKGWSSGTSRAYADNSAAVAVEKLWQDVRVGHSATVASGHLQVTVPPLITDSNGETYYDTTGGGTIYTYYVSGGNLMRQIGSGGSTVLAHDVSTASFAVTGNVVTVSVTGRNQVGMSISEQVRSAEIVLRNGMN
jgi:Tfp pilus assembly protein PilV